MENTSDQDSLTTTKRRAFLSGRNARVTSIAALALGGAALVQGKPAKPARWEPVRHDQDDWLDHIPGKHRLVFDTVMPDGFGNGIGFANNFLEVNKSAYGLQDSDSALVVVARHFSTPFAYNDAMWAKYGTIITGLIKFDDPKTKTAPKLNLFNHEEYGMLLPSRGVTVSGLAKRGAQFAVCAMATSFIAETIAKAAGGTADAVNAELIANLLPNARMVPAGIVAVNRAQERGYALAVG